MRRAAGGGGEGEFLARVLNERPHGCLFHSIALLQKPWRGVKGRAVRMQPRVTVGALLLGRSQHVPSLLHTESFIRASFRASASRFWVRLLSPVRAPIFTVFFSDCLDQTRRDVHRPCSSSCCCWLLPNLSIGAALGLAAPVGPAGSSAMRLHPPSWGEVFQRVTK